MPFFSNFVYLEALYRVWNRAFGILVSTILGSLTFSVCDKYTTAVMLGLLCILSFSS